MTRFADRATWMTALAALVIGATWAVAGGPPIVTFGVNESPNRNVRAFRLTDSLEFHIFTTDSAGNNARARLIAVADGAITDVPLPYQGGNLYESSSTASSFGIGVGLYDVEFTLCDGGFPSDCVDTSSCTCEVLPTTPSRLWIDDSPASMVASSIAPIYATGEDEPARSAIVITEADTLDVRATSAAYDPADSCSFYVTDPGFATGLAYIGGDDYRGLPVFPSFLLADGYHEVVLSIRDGLASSERRFPFKFDNRRPDAPTVTATSTAPPGYPVSIGDTITVRSLCEDAAEDTLVTRFGIDLDTALGAVPLVEQSNTPSEEHVAFVEVEFEYVVPPSLADGEGWTGDLEFWSSVSDGANRSANTLAGDSFEFDSTTPEVSKVRVEVNGTLDDCFGVGSELTFEVFGTPDVRLARLDVVRSDDETWLTDIPLTWDTFRYVGSRTITSGDVDGASIGLDGESFTMRARLGRSAALFSPELDSRSLTFVQQAPSAPVLDGVQSLPAWAVRTDEIAVIDPASLSLSGSGTPATEVFVDGGVTRGVVGVVGGDGRWSGTVDLDALGFDLTDGTPDVLELGSVVCGTESGRTSFDLRLDTTTPSSPAFEPVSPTFGADDVVRASASDDVELVGRLEVCRGNPIGGGLICSEFDMTPSSSSGVTTVEATVPTDWITPYGVRYRVMMSDGAHVVEATTSAEVGGTGADTGQTGSVFESVGVAADTWHLVSFPVRLDATDTADLFPELGTPATSRWGMFAWEPAVSGGVDEGAYVSNLGSPLAVLPGEAVWFKWLRPSGVDTRFTFDGSTVAISPFGLDLEPGWNQVGSPFAFDVAWPDGAPLLRRYANDAYTGGPITRLEPFVGYFVFADAATTISIDPVAPISLDPPRQHPLAFRDASAQAWALQIVAKNDVWSDPENFVAVRPGALAGADPWDMAEFPHPGVDEPRLSLTSHGPALAADVRPPSERVERWQLVIVVPFGHTMSDIYVSWPTIEQVPPATELRFVDRRVGTVVDPRAVESLRVRPIAGERYALDLIAGPADAVNEAATTPAPAGLRLRPAFPNPLMTRGPAGNAASRLGYEVPSAGRGSVSVFDVVGRRVETWPIAHDAPGASSVVWDGRDGRGAPVASGVYVVVLEFDGERRAQKLVVLNR